MSKPQKPAPLPPGTVVGGYQVIRKLAAGGFGVVYLAEDAERRLVALKEYLPSSLAERAPGELIPRVKPDKHEALCNWGNLLGKRAQRASDPGEAARWADAAAEKIATVHSQGSVRICSPMRCTARRMTASTAACAPTNRAPNHVPSTLTKV